MNGVGCVRNGTSSVEFRRMEATGYKVFNDSVHGHITLHPLLVKVVDTPQFQRLRNLKQLGLAYYVFPGGGHCRFEHSLGTCYLAGQMMDKLMTRTRTDSRNPDDVTKLTLCVQLAALCHDLGHGPFSHTWEEVTRRWDYNWRHEESSIEMFDYLVEKNGLESEFRKYDLEKRDLDIIKQLIMGGAYRESENKLLLPPKYYFLYEIVNNKKTGIDVDKWDYFLRDGLHLNLRITFDYRRLLEFCTVLYSGETSYLAYRDKELMNLYDMYRVRSALHHMAYRHKVVLNIELMCVDAFVEAGNAGYKLNNSTRCAIKEAHKKPENMEELTDHVFYELLYSRDPAVKSARELLERILRRDLYQFVGKVHVKLQAKEKIQEKKLKLEAKLKRLSSDFVVTDFFLGLDSQNDPMEKVSFYQKGGETNPIIERKFEEIRDIMDPFPFQLAKETPAQLFVFYKAKDVPNKLEEARQIIKEFASNST